MAGLLFPIGLLIRGSASFGTAGFTSTMRPSSGCRGPTWKRRSTASGAAKVQNPKQRLRRVPGSHSTTASCSSPNWEK